MINAPSVLFQIRPFTVDDATAYATAVSDSFRSLSEWLNWPHEHYTPDDARAWIAACDTARQDGTADEYGIFERGSGLLLGGVGIHRVDGTHRCGALGFWVCRTHQWRGIATQAALLVSGQAFSSLGMQRVELVIAEQNIASRRVAEKLGARFEGMAVNRLCIHGRQLTAAIYSLTPQGGASQA